MTEIAHRDHLSECLIRQAQTVGFDLQGPAEIEYGFGWEPTITFWHGDRRVHFYDELHGDHWYLAVEIADEGTEAAAQRAHIETIEQACDIVDRFLQQGCAPDDLSGYGFVADGLDHDKFIPHPPDTPNPANIVELIDRIKSQSKEE